MLDPALRPYATDSSSKKYQTPSVLVGHELMEVMTAIGPIVKADLNTVKLMGRRFFDDLYNCGLIPLETDPDIAWEVALVQAAVIPLYGLRLLDGESQRYMAAVFALTSKGPSKQPAPAGDALVYIVDSFLRASVPLLEYLDNDQRKPNEATSNPPDL